MSELPPFLGVFPKESTQPRSPYSLPALRDLFHSAPSFRAIAMQAMREGGERNHHMINFVGKPITGGEVRIFQRRVDNTSYHGITVALAANSLADFMGLNNEERNLFVTAAGLHDASKVLELEMMGYRELSQQKGLKNLIRNISRLPRAYNILEETLYNAGLLDTLSFGQITRDLEKLDAQGFTDYFDTKINPVFLQHVLSGSSEFADPKERQALLTIASADSVGQIPALIARASYFSEKYQLPKSGPLEDSLTHLTRYLQENGKLPDIGVDDRTNLLAMALLYCDGISQGDRIRTVDERVDEAIRRGQYAELDEQTRSLYGMTFFEANRIAMHGAEAVLLHMGKQNNLIPQNANQQELPIYIFNKILARADARANDRA